MSDPDDIRGWQRLSDRITTSGRLEDKDLPRLSSIGTKRVINLALDSHAEALADEGAKLAELGMGYTHIPIPFDAPEERHYAAFVETLEANDTPVHVHCIMNWRVSAFFYRYNREHGMNEADARALMEQQWAPDRSEYPSADRWWKLITGRDMSEL